MFNRLSFLGFCVSFLIFAGCGIISVSQADPNTAAYQDIVNGNGLESSFQVTGPDTFGELGYTLTLKNSGKEIINFKKEDITLRTINVKTDGSSLFTQASLDDFKSRLFTGDVLSLATGQSLSVKGSLFLDKNLASSQLSSISGELKFTYPYKTSFSNSVQLNLDPTLNADKKLAVLGTLSQAAPVKVYDIQLKQDTLASFSLRYYFRDDGLGPQHSVKINQYSFSFRGQPLACSFFVEKDGRGIQKDDVIIDSTTTNYISCPVTFTDTEKKDSFKSTTEGSFDYIYTVRHPFTFSIDVMKKQN